MLPNSSGAPTKHNNRTKILQHPATVIPEEETNDENRKSFIWPNSDACEDDDAMIFFSSGTTGAPKAIVLSQKSLNAYLILMNTLKTDPNESFVTFSNKDTVYGVLPYFHAGGLLTTLLMLAQGAKVLINRRFHEDEFLENISKYEVSVLLLVPPILEFLCYAPKVDPSKLSTIQYIFVGAAKVRPEHELGVIKRLPYLNKVLQLYGSTEAGVLVFMMPQSVSSTKSGSTGLPLPGVEAKVSAAPSLEYSTNFSYGELLLKTTTQMSRYLNSDDSKVTVSEESIFDEEGFMKTGDLVRVDSDGYYYIVGRLKELIKVRGWQVSPYELEEALRNRFTAITDIGIVGLPADNDGEQPTAVVVLAPGTMLSAGEIEQYVEGRCKFGLL
uniref:AMP-dependent synthetase/ligase domain-containing protein n=1 Tax=Panagrolaimus superbus TaxID=310955 RepID=A0A914YZP7_9BILA